IDHSTKIPLVFILFCTTPIYATDGHMCRPHIVYLTKRLRVPFFRSDVIIASTSSAYRTAASIPRVLTARPIGGR
ncbi:unnamed protein product, partial [Ectocarpus sp. 13 AM-2016]